jgi:hypothetical protein
MKLKLGLKLDNFRVQMQALCAARDGATPQSNVSWPRHLRCLPSLHHIGISAEPGPTMPYGASVIPWKVPTDAGKNSNGTNMMTADTPTVTKVNRKEVVSRMMKIARPEAGKIAIGLSALLVNAITNLSFPNIMRQAVDQALADTTPSDIASSLIAALPTALQSLGIFVSNNYFVVKAAGIFFVGSMASWLRVYYLGSAKERITATVRSAYAISGLNRSWTTIDLSIVVILCRKDLFESYMEKDKEFFDSCNKGDLVGKLKVTIALDQTVIPLYVLSQWHWIKMPPWQQM